MKSRQHFRFVNTAETAFVVTDSAGIWMMIDRRSRFLKRFEDTSAEVQRLMKQSRPSRFLFNPKHVCLIAVTWMPVSPAHAAVLTCDIFKARLDESSKAIGASTPKPTGFGLIRDAGRSGRSYAWTSQSLSGRLTCAADDAFADFYMRRETTPEAIDDLDGFKALAAATICALSSAKPDACHSLVDTMIEDGLDEYEDIIAKHKGRAQGLQDYDIATDLDAVFNITPQMISWAIGPGVFKTTDAERPALEPHDHDDNVD